MVTLAAVFLSVRSRVGQEKLAWRWRYCLRAVDDVAAAVQIDIRRELATGFELNDLSGGKGFDGVGPGFTFTRSTWICPIALPDGSIASGLLARLLNRHRNGAST
jgi:hypothetical protein